MTLICRLRIACVAAAVAGLSWSARPAAAQTTVLESSSGPTATYGTTVNFTTLGTADWVFYGGATTGAGVTAAAGNEKVGNSLFSPVSLVSASPTGKNLNLGSGSTGVTYTDGTSPTSLTNNLKNVYVHGGAIGDGVSFSYQLPGNTTQTLDLYVESYDGTGEVSVSSAASGTLFSQSAPVALPSATSAPNNGEGAYQFTVSNLSAIADKVTFTDLLEATSGGSASVGFEGATVADVTAAPEPTSAATLALASAALASVRRRRRPHA